MVLFLVKMTAYYYMCLIKSETRILAKFYLYFYQNCMIIIAVKD